jgi:PPOX class probable FMN-dependent enzyme
MASANAQGIPEVSPRGDLPGFVAVLNERTLVIPDRPGNKKIVTLSNIVGNPHVALIFFVPGRVEALRINGTAQITADSALLAPLAVQGKEPKSALLVTVAYASLHCGKALTRSHLWESDAQVAPDALPTFGQMLADEIAGVDAAATDVRLENVYKHGLW